MEKSKELIKKWNELIGLQDDSLKKELTDLEISTLSACIGDCYESFNEVYFELFDKLETASTDDHELVHDCVVDIYWQFNHIKNHIEAAEKGFTVLMEILAEKAESKPDINHT